MTYTIKLPHFEGPFDLLLFFIERDELDIYDIPIAQLTNDFLSYIRQLEMLNIDVASDFVLVTSTLMRIKAKLLIPRKEIDEEGNEIDPRQELVQKILEYKNYKSLCIALDALENERLQKYKRGNLSIELQQISNQALADAELENLNLYKLLKTYHQLVQKFQQREEQISHQILKYEYTVEQKAKDIVDFVFRFGKMSAISLLEKAQNRLEAIFLFLAVLDLLQQEQIFLKEDPTEVNSFVLLPNLNFASEETSNFIE